MESPDIEAVISENVALKRQLDSKGEALLILAEELAKCRRERDEQKQPSERKPLTLESMLPKKNDTPTYAELLKVANRALLKDISDLRNKLDEAYSDLKVLRSNRVNISPSELKLPSPQVKEELVQEVEETKAQLRYLKLDLHAVLDEKEELVKERDAYRCRLSRISHVLANVLKAPNPIDVDAILMENKYLTERLELALEEIDMKRQRIARYKEVLTRSKVKSSDFLELRKGDDDCGCRVISNREVRELLGKDESFWDKAMTNRETTVADLKALCNTLVESLHERSLQFTHQKKVSSMLAEQVKYLEGELEKCSIVTKPSHFLLDGYSPCGVDTLPRLNLDNEEKKDLKEENTDKENEDSLKQDKIDNKGEEDEKLPEELEKLVNEALQEVQASALHN